MDPEERRLLGKILELTEENNRMLRYMRRGVLLRRIGHIIRVIILIAIAVAIYYFIRPYISKIESLMKTVESIQNSIPFKKQ